MSNDKFSNEELEAKYGRRSKGTPLFEPQELGYRCPKGHAHLAFSEFNKHIWCYICKKDYYYADCLLVKDDLNPKNLPEQPRIITGIENFAKGGNGFNDIPKEKLEIPKSKKVRR